MEELQQYRAIGTVEELTALKENCIEPSSLRLYLTQLEKYHAIGTIDEFKAFKLGRLGNKGFITIGQTMEEYAQKIRANAIDEFAEKLNTDVESFVAEVNGVRADLLTLDYFSEFVFEVAEQLKGVQEC